jgi:hypothetical protein
MAYWLHRWISANSARSLAVALVFWAAGMYVFMEIAPAALLVPVLWLVYRPPIRLASLTIALVASVSLWWPYLLYQRTRDFQDLHALLSRTPLYASGVPANVRQPWCDERLPMEGGGGTSGNLSVDVATMADAERGLLVRTVDFGYGALQKWHAMLGNAVRGMTRSLVPATLTATVALCLASVVSLLALALGSPRMRHWALSRPTVQQPAWCTGLGVAFLAIGLSAGVLLPRLLSRDGSLDPATRDTLFGLQIDILIVSAVFLGFRFLRLALHRLAEAMAIGPGPSSANHLFIALEHF